MRNNTLRASVAVLAVLSLFVAPALAGDKEKGEGSVVSTFKVDGMTCGGCAAGLRLAVKKLEGVGEIKVSHEEGMAKIAYDPEVLTADKIAETIEKQGYKVKLEKTEKA